MSPAMANDSAPEAGPAFCLHRSQRAPAGRAHGDRGGHRGGHRQGPDPTCRRGIDCRARVSTRPAWQEPRGYAIQARVCMESIHEDGSIRPTGGTLSCLRGHRADRACAPTGSATAATRPVCYSIRCSPRSSAILPQRTFADAIARTSRALSRIPYRGVDTNIAFLQSILAHQDFASANIDTRFVDNRDDKSLATASSQQPSLRRARRLAGISKQSRRFVGHGRFCGCAGRGQSRTRLPCSIMTRR